jgi:hypothetical protein
MNASAPAAFCSWSMVITMGCCDDCSAGSKRVRAQQVVGAWVPIFALVAFVTGNRLVAQRARLADSVTRAATAARCGEW